MIRRVGFLTALGVAVLASVAGWHLTGRAQQPAANRGRFEFVVVESFDAQYLGDTPGHIGRGGVLGRSAPNVALGDPVYRGNVQVGQVSTLRWDQAKESLEIEFDPEPLRVDPGGRLAGTQRISIGEAVWVRTDGAAAAPGR